MKPENKIISGLWIARDSNLLSNMERLCIHSFCANRHDFHLYIYDDIANVPTDTVGGKVKVCDANEILPASKIFTYSESNSLAGFADWFRWELMRSKGGWYVDMDVVCLRPFDFSQDVIFAYDDYYANSAIMKFPATHPLVTAVADACASPNQIQPWDNRRRIKIKNRRRRKFWSNPHKNLQWGEAGGPDGFTLALEHFQVPYLAPSIALQGFECCGHLSRMIDQTLWDLELLKPILKNSYSIHWFHEIWRHRGWDKTGTFAEHSPYEILKRRYLPEYK